MLRNIFALVLLTMAVLASSTNLRSHAELSPAEEAALGYYSNPCMNNCATLGFPFYHCRCACNFALMCPAPCPGAGCPCGDINMCGCPDRPGRPGACNSAMESLAITKKNRDAKALEVRRQAADAFRQTCYEACTKRVSTIGGSTNGNPCVTTTGIFGSTTNCQPLLASGYYMPYGKTPQMFEDALRSCDPNCCIEMRKNADWKDLSIARC